MFSLESAVGFFASKAHHVNNIHIPKCRVFDVEMIWQWEISVLQGTLNGVSRSIGPSDGLGIIANMFRYLKPSCSPM